MECTIIQTSNQKDKGVPCQKKEARKEEAPVASTRKPQVTQPPQNGNKYKKTNWRKPYAPSYSVPKIPKDAMENVFNMTRTLMELKDKEEKGIRQPYIPKE
ncbi:hypothetical protein O181_089495 [Austropuccinia psidii MF-1]|uniref:Uncharacterized protein n=1 Tax=Austropuccinia psidii MF-1 TaxID=1389203 RepID=A0A9Q3ITD7_9BASI|nr:hypothetical protein [Austropuccinia psidii MF-1]